MMMKHTIAALVCVASLAVTAARADTYPSKPVKFVVPQAPGGATDVFARYVGKKLSEKWGEPVVVENRAGAAGVVGTDAVAKSAPDGYTLLVTYAGSQAVNQSLYAKLPFDSVKDFETVATVARTPFFLVTAAHAPFQDFHDFIAQAKSKPGAITYASSGNGSINHLMGESLKTEAHVDLLHIPYKAIAAAMADVIGGQVNCAFAAVPASIGLIRGGKLRALAVSSTQRNPAAPDVPTIAESGYPGFDIDPWWGILAPAGTPRAIVDKVNADVAEVLRAPETEAFLRNQGADALVTTPSAFHELLVEDVGKWAKVVKSSGARID
jgi:tripartite-type tricarboxylate transporter receptor subunit TctC